MRRTGLPDSCPGRVRVAGFLLCSALPIIAFGCVVALRPASAEADDGIEELVITGEKPATPDVISPTSFATVIEAADHAAELGTVTDALAESVGIQVRRYGGLGAFSTVSIRGSSSNQVQIYLDGIPISRARNETVNLSDLPIDSLDRIEVYRGTVPIQFGVAGSGGIVNLTTKPPLPAPTTDLSASYGSFETRKIVASHSRAIGGLSLLGHVSYLGSKGDFDFKEDLTPGLPGDRKVSMTRENNDFDSVDAILKASYHLDARTRIDALTEVFYKDQGVPGPAGQLVIRDVSFEDLRSLNYLRIDRRGFLSDAVDASASIFGTYLVERFTDKEDEFGRGPQDRDDTTINVGANATATYTLSPDNTVSWFSELSYEQFSPRNEVQRRPDGPDQERLRWTFALQDDLWLLPGWILLVPATRYEHLDDDVTASFSPAGMPMGRQTVSHDLWSGSIGAQVLPTEWLILKGNLGRYQRAPNFSELFGNSAGVSGNPELNSETAINRDIGFILAPDPFPWSTNVLVEYAYFNNDIDDLISLVQTSATTARPLNIGGARIRGHEVVFNLDLLDHVSFDLNFTHQDTEDRSSEVDFVGEQLPFRPADELYTRVELYDDLGRLYYEFNYIGSNYLRRKNLSRSRVDERDIHTAGIAIPALDWLTLRLEARNLTDNQITDVANYPLPGRSFFGSVAAEF